MFMKDSHIQDSWYLLPSLDLIRMLSPKVCSGEKKNIQITGIYHIFQLIHTIVGSEYESDVIRINSQSGKGGISYVLEENIGFHIPGKMREDVGYTVKDVSDKRHQELQFQEIS